MENFDFFWKTIKSCNWKYQGDDEKVLAPVIKKLSKMPDEDIHSFNEMMTELLYQLDSKSLFNEFSEYIGYENGDKFLYARCAALVNGENFYNKVLKGEEFIWDKEFESLLDVPERAWELKHKNKNYTYATNFSYETESNSERWEDSYQHYTYKGRRTFVSGDDCWIIDYTDNSLYTIWSTQFGYVKHKYKEFKTIDELKKTIDKRVSDKIKAGYVENNDYSDYTCIIGAKTAHTKELYHHNFAQHFTNSIYYAEKTQYAPFDISIGIDVLMRAQHSYYAGKKTDFLSHPKYMIKEFWKYNNYYNPLECSENTIINEEVYVSLVTTYCTAFSQIKITGMLDNELKKMALEAIKILQNSFAKNNEKSKLAKLHSDLSDFIAI